MKARIAAWWRELKLQIRIRIKEGRRELDIYRLERNYGMSLIWAPSEGRWVRARAERWGQKYVRVRFVDGAEKTGTRSPLSIRPRDPRLRGGDLPPEDARYSGNRGDRSWAKIVADITFAGVKTAIATEKFRQAFFDTSMGIPYEPEG